MSTTATNQSSVTDNAVAGSNSPPVIQPELDGDDETQDLEQELKVTFFPPLQAARSGWILGHLRKERVSSVCTPLTA